jgi:uncharacterized protein (TIGR02246 family)
MLLNALVLAFVLAMMPNADRKPTTAELATQVRAAETAFARTMADRDLATFTAMLAEETIFFGGKGAVHRGRAAVAEDWKRFYVEKEAPFSWQPQEVEVLDSGTLGISSGPVFAPDGTRIGTYNSIWRLEADGRWRIIFDKGCPPCDCGEGKK